MSEAKWDHLVDRLADIESSVEELGGAVNSVQEDIKAELKNPRASDDEERFAAMQALKNDATTWRLSSEGHLRRADKAERELHDLRQVGMVWAQDKPVLKARAERAETELAKLQLQLADTRQAMATKMENILDMEKRAEAFKEDGVKKAARFKELEELQPMGERLAKSIERAQVNHERGERLADDLEKAEAKTEKLNLDVASAEKQTEDALVRVRSALKWRDLARQMAAENGKRADKAETRLAELFKSMGRPKVNQWGLIPGPDGLVHITLPVGAKTLTIDPAKGIVDVDVPKAGEVETERHFIGADFSCDTSEEAVRARAERWPLEDDDRRSGIEPRREKDRRAPGPGAFARGRRRPFSDRRKS